MRVVQCDCGTERCRCKDCSAYVVLAVTSVRTVRFVRVTLKVVKENDGGLFGCNPGITYTDKYG